MDWECCGVGYGGPTRDEWRNTPEETPLGTILKKLFFHFLDAGYVPGEFQLVAWDACVTLQFEEATKGVVWGD
jgi:hypothetical protein